MNDKLSQLIDFCNKLGINYTRFLPQDTMNRSRLTKPGQYRDDSAEDLLDSVLEMLKSEGVNPTTFLEKFKSYLATRGGGDNWNFVREPDNTVSQQMRNLWRNAHPIKLSESQLRGMIAECVKKVLSERYLEP